MSIRAARRTAGIRYANREVVQLAEEAQRRGRKLLNLNIGDPNIFGFRTPECIQEAMIRAIRENHNGYSHSSGLAEARAAIRRQAESRGLRKVQEVLVTNGGSEAIDMALSALVNSGDNVLLPAPGYPLYAALLSRLEAETRRYRLDESNNWQPDIEHMAEQIDGRTRAIVLINPNNPTGCVYSRETIEAVIDLCRGHKLVLISDEIYDRILFNGHEHVPSASLADDVCIVTINGLSKNYIAPGLRCGWSITSGPAGLCEDYLQGMRKLSRVRLSAGHPQQHAIAPALLGAQEHLPPLCDILSRRARFCAERLNAIEGVQCVEPQGAFYAFPSLQIAGRDEDFVRELILETGVIVVQGSGFGLQGQPSYFRIVTLPGDEVLAEAFDRIEDFLGSWRRRHPFTEEAAAPAL